MQQDLDRIEQTAKRPTEFARITELQAAIRALAREAARADHSNEPKDTLE